MAPKSRLASAAHFNDDALAAAKPLMGAGCCCLADFFREEFIKHHHCLEEQREYFSDKAIAQAEDALQRIMAQMEQLCQRDDACEVVAQLLKQIDSVTKLSAWTTPEQLH